MTRAAAGGLCEELAAAGLPPSGAAADAGTGRRPGRETTMHNTSAIVRWCGGVPIVNARALREEALSRMGRTWNDYKTGEVEHLELAEMESKIRKEALT